MSAKAIYTLYEIMKKFRTVSTIVETYRDGFVQGYRQNGVDLTESQGTFLSIREILKKGLPTVPYLTIGINAAGQEFVKKVDVSIVDGEQGLKGPVWWCDVVVQLAEDTYALLPRINIINLVLDDKFVGLADAADAAKILNYGIPT